MPADVISPSSHAVLKHARFSAYKAREVLGQIKGMHATRALALLEATDRAAAIPIAKLLSSALANAETNEDLDKEDLYVSSCFADEATTMKRWRPRARGRATRIRKRTCHITIVVSRLPEEDLARLRSKKAAEATSRREKRVASTRKARVENSKTSVDVSEKEIKDGSEVSDESATRNEAAEKIAIDLELEQDDNLAEDEESGESPSEDESAHRSEASEKLAIDLEIEEEADNGEGE
ncbi:MAG: 50S ribosomal protein L22 [Acidimicrobiales bacterium]|nr:50S ribosomal protein L22 [Acidimicrobiales bacterium]